MPNLCEAINDLVYQRLRDAFETGHTINMPDLASEITESLADLIVCSAPSEEQPRLIAHVVVELGRFVKERARLVWVRSCSSGGTQRLRLRTGVDQFRLRTKSRAGCYGQRQVILCDLKMLGHALV